MTAARKVPLGDLLGANERESHLDAEAIARLRDGDSSALADLDEAEREALLADAKLFEALKAGDPLTAEERAGFDAADAELRRRLGLPDGASGTVAIRRPDRRWWLATAAGLTLAAILLSLILPAGRGFVPVDDIPLLAPPTVRGMDAVTWEAVEEAWAREDWDGVRQRLDEGLAAAPGDVGLRTYRAIAGLRSGRTSAAAEDVAELQRLEGDVPSGLTWWLQAAIESRRGDDESACASLRQVVALGGARSAEAAGLIESHCR